MGQNIQLSDEQYAGVALDTMQELVSRLAPAVQTFAQVQNYDSEYGFIHLPFDDHAFSAIQACVNKKQKLKPVLCVLVGIGGSNLGVQAVMQALGGLLYNDQQPLVRLYYADTVDVAYLEQLLSLVEQELCKKNPIILTVISKSGTTTETIINFEIFLSLLKKYHPTDYHHYVVAITDKNSLLWDCAQHQQFDCLEIPTRVGGRYSVFSAVGLFCLGLVGVDSAALLEGARSITSLCVAPTLENSAARSASIIFEQYRNGIALYDLFLFSVELEALGKWCRQLVAESLGKEFLVTGQQKPTGITPTVSVGSVDLHSMVQLYVSGPAVRLTTFVSVAHNNNALEIPVIKDSMLPAAVQKKSIAAIMKALCAGTKKAYANKNRPFFSLEIPEKNAYYIGQFLQYKMIETVYIGYLLGVNPFDQPGVEEYKKETRKILENG